MVCVSGIGTVEFGSDIDFGTCVGPNTARKFSKPLMVSGLNRKLSWYSKLF